MRDAGPRTNVRQVAERVPADIDLNYRVEASISRFVAARRCMLLVGLLQRMSLFRVGAIECAG